MKGQQSELHHGHSNERHYSTSALTACTYEAICLQIIAEND